ncbi:MAG: hypothetical protein Q9190_003854 [Brigantiaea leucoxantha]
MPEETLLSELCKICHINPHKYCCPRCSARTCSLPCLKRHKQWAACSGTRDPTVYIKRAELATPRGIDHDYNYLTSIERQLDKAERDAEARGIMLDNGLPMENGWRIKRSHGPAKGEIFLKQAFQERRIVVDKAPDGMSRHKQNKTFWHKK